MSEARQDGAIDTTPAGDLGLLRRLWPFARPDAWTFIYALLVTPLIAATSLAQPWLIKKVIDEHIVPGVADGLTALGMLFLGAVVAAYLLEASYTLAIAWGGQRTMLRLRLALYRHTLGRAQAFFDRRPAGLLLTRLTSDVDALGEALGAGVVTLALDALMIVGTLAAMFWLDWQLTAVLLLLAPVLLAALELMRRRLRTLFLEIREALAQVNAFLTERVDGVEVVQLYRAEAMAGAEFDRRNRRFRDASTTSNVYDALMFAVVDGFSSVCIAVMLWYGAGLAAEAGLEFLARDPVTPGLLVAFIDYLDRLFRPLRDASGKIAVLQRAAAALVKIFGLFEEAEVVRDGGRPLGALAGELVLEDVRFAYRADVQDVLNGVNLVVRPGEVVALVGATGSGKTTITRLLDRSYDGYRGSIRLDGVELSDLKLRDLRRNVAAVRQDIQLFSESVRFNVDLGNPAISAGDTDAAAALVHADACVARVGWDHVLRERGADVSVGEGQLLTFARTMAHDPGLIILDEATASVDSLTEALIQDAIARIFSRKTVIVVAHRLSTIQSADRIAVVDRGVIVEQGNHDELMALGGRYAALVAAGEDALAG